MAHATSADLVNYYDERTVGQLLSDDGTAIAAGAFATNAKLTAIISWASGQVDAALKMGDRYTTADLSTDLAGDSREYLRGITCDIAMWRLYARRPLYDVDRYQKAKELAEGHLKLLAEGREVFDLAAQRAAADPTINGPTASDYATLNMIPDRVRNYYPSRASRLPTNRS